MSQNQSNCLYDWQEEVETLAETQITRKEDLISEQKRGETKSNIAKVGIKEVAKRLEEENMKTRVDFYQGLAQWAQNSQGFQTAPQNQNFANSSRQGSPKKDTFFNEQVNMQERKNLSSKIKCLQVQLASWLKETGTEDIKGLKQFILHSTEVNAVHVFL